MQVSATLRRWVWLSATTALLLVLAVGINPPGDAVLGAPLSQKMAIPSGDAALFVQLFPRLQELPGPAWLAEGVRFTYAVQSANVNEAAGAGSGAGYLQYDVVAVDAKSVAVMSQFYLENTGGELTPATSLPSLALPAVGDSWLNPAVLVNAERVANDALMVVRTQRADGAGDAHHTVRFQSTTAKLEQVWEFDESTGILVFFRMRYGDADEPEQLTQSLLVNQRRLPIPWRGSRAPTWVKVGATLHYEGSYTAAILGGAATTLPYVVAADITQRDKRWSLAHLASFSSGFAAGEQMTASGVGQLFGGLWLPAEALRARPTRQLLDRDPITHAELTWQRGADRSIILTERGRAFETRMVYDGSSGMLIAYQQRIVLPTATTTVALELVN